MLEPAFPKFALLVALSVPVTASPVEEKEATLVVFTPISTGVFVVDVRTVAYAVPLVNTFPATDPSNANCTPPEVLFTYTG